MSQPPRLIALVNVARLLGLGGLMLAACTGTVNVSGTGGGSATGAGGATDTAGSTGTAGRGASGAGGSAGAPGAGVGGASGGNPGAGGSHFTLNACLEASGWLLVGFVLIWVVAHAVFGPGRITYHRVIGAILLYLTIGIVFVALYTLVGALAPGSFTGISVHDRVSLPPDLVYFSFTTITTVGFGDIVPIHPFARSLSNLEAILGQLYPATLLARMVSLEIGSGR